MTWPMARAWLPFLQGAVAAAAITIGFVIAWHSVPAATEKDWQFFIVQFLCAACIGCGGVILLLTALEMRK